MRFSDSYTPAEFLAFRQRLATACRRLRWNKTELNNFSLQTIDTDVQDNLAKQDWEHLLACMEDLPTPPPLNAAPQCAAPDAALLAFVQMASSDELHGLYRAMCKRLHPDTGGDVVRMRQLNLLWEKLEKTDG